MSFKPVGSLDPHGGPLLLTKRLDDSLTGIGEDDYCFFTEGAAEGWVSFAEAGQAVLGIIQSIVTENGIGMTSDGASGDYIGHYDTASTNTTTEKIAAVVDISQMSLASVDPDDTLATTTGSGKDGYRCDLVTVTESTKNSDEDTAATGANAAQMAIHGVDPMDSGNHILSIFEHNIFGPVAA